MHIGVDIGGTFTDFVVFNPISGKILTFKILSTPKDPAAAMLSGLEIFKDKNDIRIIHGSTVSTNALLERKGARTALITTKGFRDVLQIGRQNRLNLYDLRATNPPPIIPREWRYEIEERVDHTGTVTKQLDQERIPKLIQILKKEGIESVAVSFLFSFLHPEHEEQVESALEEAGFNTSISSKVLAEFREYERTSTTAVNAYVSPIINNYLSKLENNLKNSELRIMQSNGGSISPIEARKNAVRCILSGPAGGVVGAKLVANLAGFTKILSFDMGGTSTDVSLIAGDLEITTESNVGGLPIGIPILDIHTVGAGGGSIASVDSGNSLNLGPESAGADPGPACYGKGLDPTTTDANLVLGRLDPGYFLGGEMKLDKNRSEIAIEKISSQIGIDKYEVANGIIQVANAHMERALRVISIEKGHDPRDFTLVSFGGAGGLHAVELARSLNIPKVLIPPQAATLSALGMLMTDVVKDYAITLMLPGNVEFKQLEVHFSPLLNKTNKDLTEEKIGKENIRLERSLDIRYQGQSFELNIHFSPNFIDDFHKLHKSTYGYRDKSLPIEIVNIRLKAIGMIKKPKLEKFKFEGKSSTHALISTKGVHLNSGMKSVNFYNGEKLIPGNFVKGPAIIVRQDTTILIEEKDSADVDEYKNLIITVTPLEAGKNEI